MRWWGARGRTALRRLRRNKERVACLAAALAVWILGLTWGAGVPGPPESWNAVWHLPVLTDALAILQEGRLPLWNSRLGFGYPVWPVEGALLANPLAWPFLDAGPVALLREMVVTHLLVSLAAFWLLARRSGSRRGAALLGALAYAGNGWLVARLFSGAFDAAVLAATLPLALLVRSGRSSRTVRWLAAGLLAAWSAVGAGLTGLAVALISLALLKGLSCPGRTPRPPRPASRRPAALLALLCFPLLAGAAVLVPAAEFWCRTQVSPLDPDPASVSLSLSAIPEVFLPGLCGGGRGVPRWAGPAAAPAGIYAGWLLLLPIIVWPAASMDARSRILTATRVAGVAFGLALIGSVFPFSRLARLFPETASLLGLSRFAAAGTFALAWVIMVSADVALRRTSEIHRCALITFSVAAAACLLAALLLSFLPSSGERAVSEPNFTRTVLLFQAGTASLWTVLFWSAGRWRRLSAALPELAALAAVLDLLAGSRHVRVWTSPEYFRLPAHLAVLAPDARLAVPHRSALRPAFLLQESGGVAVIPATAARLPVNMTQSMLDNPLLGAGAVAAGNDAELANSLRQLAAFGVTHLAVPDGRGVPAASTGAVLNESHSGVQEAIGAIPGSLGRLWGVREIVAVEGRRTAVRRLARPGFDPAAAAVSTEVVEWPGSGTAMDSAAPDTSRPFTARVSAEPPNRLEVRAWTPHPAVLIVADTSWPGWRAEVNGRRTPIHEVNGWLRAVVLREGVSHVRFRFQPFSLRLGLFLTLTASAVWMAVAMRYASRHIRRFERRD